MPGWKETPVKAGTLVLIHGGLTHGYAAKLTAGSVMHRSPPNPSDKTRLIYTFHMIDGSDGITYDEKNWLQPGPGGFHSLL